MLGLGVARDHDWAAVSKWSIPQVAHSVKASITIEHWTGYYEAGDSTAGESRARRSLVRLGPEEFTEEENVCVARRNGYGKQECGN